MSKSLIYYQLDNLQNYRDKYAIELFDRLEKDLSMDEIQLLNEYIHDTEYPVWKRIYIENESTIYEISCVGEIRIHINNIIEKVILNKPNHIKKYIYFNFTNNQKSYHMLLHRLVAQAFIPNPENKPEVNHINGNKHCNWYKNLEWNTRQENATHAKENSLMLKGSISPASKHTEQEAHEVCKLIEKGMKAEAISKALNISKAFVIGILYRGEWSHVSSQYNIPKPKHFLDVDTVHEICKHLEQGKRDFEIAEELGLSWYDVNTIHRGKAWRRISNQYNIPGLVKTDKIEMKLSERIIDILNSGVTESDSIIKILGLKKSKSLMKYINRMKHKIELIK